MIDKSQALRRSANIGDLGFRVMGRDCRMAGKLLCTLGEFLRQSYTEKVQIFWPREFSKWEWGYSARISCKFGAGLQFHVTQQTVESLR